MPGWCDTRIDVRRIDGAAWHRPNFVGHWAPDEVGRIRRQGGMIWWGGWRPQKMMSLVWMAGEFEEDSMASGLEEAIALVAIHMGADGAATTMQPIGWLGAANPAPATPQPGCIDRAADPRLLLDGLRGCGRIKRPLPHQHAPFRQKRLEPAPVLRRRQFYRKLLRH